MRLKLVLALFLLCGVYANAQQDNGAIYCVYFFKSSNTGGYKEAIFQVDSLGNVVENDNPTGEKVNMKSFTKSIHSFVEKENIPFIKPSPDADSEYGYDEDSEAHYPAEGEQVLYISVVFAKDHVVGGDFSGEAYYSFEYIGADVKKTSYSIYKYLSADDLKVIKSKLEY